MKYKCEHTIYIRRNILVGGKEGGLLMRRNISKSIMTVVMAAGLAMASLVTGTSGGFNGMNNANVDAVSRVYAASETGAESVVIIKDTIDWKSFASTCNSDNNYYEGTIVKLANDISFDGRTQNNYDSINDFYGTFDGCGHRISGMISTNGGGLFQYNSGMIKNVTVANSTFNSDESILGSIVCNNKGTIDNCHTQNTKVILSNSVGRAGGIAGENSGEILNCTVSADVSIQGVYSGGICGNLFDIGEINNCANLGRVSGEEVGGIASHIYEINNSYNAGKVTSTESNDSAGIAYEAEGVIWNCYFSVESASIPIVSTKQTSNRVDHFKASAMQSASFCNSLNYNRGSHNEWFEWELGKSGYPVIGPLRNMSTCIVNVSSGYKYAGSPVVASVNVKYKNKTLVKGIDYSLTYSNNNGAGTAKATVTGMGQYINSVSKTFVIIKGDTVLSCSKLNGKKFNFGSSKFINAYAVKGAAGTFSYSSSNKKVAKVSKKGQIKFVGVGTAVISVKASGTNNYNGASLSIKVNVIPKKPTVKVKAGKKRMIISYKKVKGASGYEIQYSLKKSFKSGVKKINLKKTKRTVKKLKRGKKYYVRVRAFKKVGKKKIYSNWSKVKSVKIKK